MVDFGNREGVMREWDKWRAYIAGGGGGSWPRDAFESLLDYYDEQIEDLRNFKVAWADAAEISMRALKNAEKRREEFSEKEASIKACWEGDERK